MPHRPVSHPRANNLGSIWKSRINIRFGVEKPIKYSICIDLFFVYCINKYILVYFFQYIILILLLFCTLLDIKTYIIHINHLHGLVNI